MNPEVFRPYSSDHLIAVAGCAVAIAVPIILASRWKRTNPARENALRRALAAFGLVFWFAYSIWWNWNTLDVQRGLPLHVCDVAGLIAPLALLTQSRWLRATLYFWGLTLSLQGFIQPVLRVGPVYLEYWGFWAAHAIIVGSALYDLIAGGFRPTLRDVGRATIVSLAYIAVILPFDIALGVNYGYIGNAKPENPTLIDKLGDWPGRVGTLFIIGTMGFMVAWAPWGLAKLIKERRAARGRETK